MLDKQGMELMSQGHLLEEELGEIKLKRKHINLDKGKGKQIARARNPVLDDVTGVAVLQSMT